MPPKKAVKVDKTKEKQKQKAAEDKTFGLKNKNKSSKVQKYVQQVHQAAAQSKGQPSGPTKKDLEKQKKEEMNELFKPVQVAQKVPFGVDPKTIMCQFFKLGTCTKGKSCKFAHDSAVERKAAKIDLYTDARETTAVDKENDTIDAWDQAKLEDVVEMKHGKGIHPTTDIVCRYFIQAIEDRKYGWFWQCPNGDGCKYRHALPPGFVLRDQKKKVSDEPVQTLEEWIEAQRLRLPDKVTPVTLETFKVWKQQRMLQMQADMDEKAKQTEAAVKAGRSIGASGRDLFTYNPELFNMGDDEEAWDGDYTLREEEEGEQEGGEQEAYDEALFEGEDLDGLDLGEDDDE